MSGGSMVSIALTLAVVLGVMGIALKLLRRYTMGTTSSTSNVPMEVVQRLTIGQRQGIAVVRIGTRLLAVSVGDGGVRPIAELSPSELPATPATQSTPDVLNLRAMTTSIVNSTKHAKAAARDAARDAVAATRVSYVAPIEDFQAVLNMTMREPAPAHR